MLIIPVFVKLYAQAHSPLGLSDAGIEHIAPVVALDVPLAIDSIRIFSILYNVTPVAMVTNAGVKLLLLHYKIKQQTEIYDLIIFKYFHTTIAI